MTRCYVAGGVAFATNEELPDLATKGFADVEVRLRFASRAEVRSAHPEALRVSGPADLTGWIDPATLTCWLPPTHTDPKTRSWHLRQMAPIFSAVMGRLVLHAGAVAINGAIVAFVGESGAGKTTLARYLALRSHAFAADDLLPIRFDPQPTAPVDDRLLPIRAITFLSRSDTAAVEADPLSPVATLQRLVVHGFGEHGDRTTWQFQFDAYHRLAESVPAFSLTIPNDLSALPSAEAALIALASDGARSPSIDGEF